MSEMTQEDALRLADELAEQALKETSARCSVLAAFIAECDRAGATTRTGARHFANSARCMPRVKGSCNDAA